MFIYLITNTVNGKVYVGKTERLPQVRWHEHCEDCIKRPHLAPLLYRALRKHGMTVFTFDVIAQAVSAEHLNALERLWILVLRAAEGKYGYNLTLGGIGGKPSEATLEKLHKPKSAEHKLAISAAAKRRGTAHMSTAEARNRRGLKLKGRVFSEATRLKMSESAKRRAASNPAHLSLARAARLPQIHGVDGQFVHSERR